VKEILEKIAVFADDAHGDQVRKYADERYIQHPLRVMKTCQDRGYPLPVLAAAILHDVLEDTDKSREEIKEFLLTVMEETATDHTLALVIELTDVYTKANYPRLNRRKRKAKEINRLGMASAEAQTIKYADIIDNAIGIAGNDPDFGPVFLKECEALLNKMQNGEPVLHDAAKAVIKKEMEELKCHHLHS
jgi:guanosine-3',5'-bis(diphosphate) 3'-pyrophosphohydrolase